MDTLICNGTVLMEGGRVLTIDERALLRESEKIARAIAKRAKIAHLAAPKWPIV